MFKGEVKREKFCHNIKDIGGLLGYPVCCIESACNIFSITNIQIGVSKGGFIPCVEHTLQILDNKIKIEDLVKRNDDLPPFPHCSFIYLNDEIVFFDLRIISQDEIIQLCKNLSFNNYVCTLV